MKRFITVLLVIFFSQSAISDFDYDRNLIACLHGFSTCSPSLVSKSDVDIETLTRWTSEYLENQAKIASSQKKSIGSYPSSTSSSKYSSPSYPSSTSTYTSSSSRGCAENASCYGDISSLTGRPKTVSVSGYYRKDGTYVRGHYRSKPKKK